MSANVTLVLTREWIARLAWAYVLEKRANVRQLARGMLTLAKLFAKCVEKP